MDSPPLTLRDALSVATLQIDCDPGARVLASGILKA